MSFGSVQSMITTLKNNDKMRSKRAKFKKTRGGYRSQLKPEYNLPEATSEVLKAIRERLKRAHRVRTIKVIVISATIIAVLLLVIFM